MDWRRVAMKELTARAKQSTPDRLSRLEIPWCARGGAMERSSNYMRPSHTNCILLYDNKIYLLPGVNIPHRLVDAQVLLYTRPTE